MKPNFLDRFLSLAILAIYGFLVYYSYKHPDKAMYCIALIMFNSIWGKLNIIQTQLLGIKGRLK